MTPEKKKKRTGTQLEHCAAEDTQVATHPTSSVWYHMSNGFPRGTESQRLTLLECELARVNV
jgi:hypothetical protein